MILLTEDQSRLLAAEPEAVVADPLTGRRYALRPLPAAAAHAGVKRAMTVPRSSSGPA